MSGNLRLHLKALIKLAFASVENQLLSWAAAQLTKTTNYKRSAASRTNPFTKTHPRHTLNKC